MSIDNCYSISFSGVSLPVVFLYPETADYFQCSESDRLDCIPSNAIHTTTEELSEWEKIGNSADAFGEYCLLCRHISSALMKYDRFVFHGAAVRYNNRAWLISAASGVGKTTQCMRLLEKHGDEVSIINGDKPILEIIKDDTVVVHPSPWNGKEGLRGASSAPLGGIFFLKRDSFDAVSLCDRKYSSVYGFISVFQTFQDEALIRKAAELTEKLLKSVSVWMLTSCDIEKTSQLLYEKMREEVMSNGI